MRKEMEKYDVLCNDNDIKSNWKHFSILLLHLRADGFKLFCVIVSSLVRLVSVLVAVVLSERVWFHQSFAQLGQRCELKGLPRGR